MLTWSVVVNSTQHLDLILEFGIKLLVPMIAFYMNDPFCCEFEDVYLSIQKSTIVPVLLSISFSWLTVKGLQIKIKISHLSFAILPGQVCDDDDLSLIEVSLGYLFSLPWGLLISQVLRSTSGQSETNETDLALWRLWSSHVGPQFVLNLHIWLLK